MSINTGYSNLLNFTNYFINNFLEKLTALYIHLYFTLRRILNGYFFDILNPSKNIVNIK